MRCRIDVRPRGPDALAARSRNWTAEQYPPMCNGTPAGVIEFGHRPDGMSPVEPTSGGLLKMRAGRYPCTTHPRRTGRGRRGRRGRDARTRCGQSPRYKSRSDVRIKLGPRAAPGTDLTKTRSRIRARLSQCFLQLHTSIPGSVSSRWWCWRTEDRLGGLRPLAPLVRPRPPEPPGPAFVPPQGFQEKTKRRLQRRRCWRHLGEPTGHTLTEGGTTEELTWKFSRWSSWSSSR
jgi:hypothetical protein